jgi:uncharacterized protein (TIGR02246 family)
MDELWERHQEWTRVVNTRDVEAYAELVAEDIVWIPPAGEAVVGRQAFREWLEPFFGSYHYEYSSSNSRYRPAGDWIAESGEFETRMTPVSGGSPMSHVGSYMVIWRRDRDGAWRIERYVDQSSL